LAEVRLQEGESIDNALRRFKRKVQTEDIIKEVKRHSFYLKPGAKRRVKQALARKRARKKISQSGRHFAGNDHATILRLAICGMLRAFCYPLFFTSLVPFPRLWRRISSATQTSLLEFAVELFGFAAVTQVPAR
jgi:small subunit ribosomal protein S21